MVLDVPRFDEDTPAFSSLILADTMEKVPANKMSGINFAMGDMKVRPRLGNNFTTEEKMGIYLQMYNFSSLSGSIRYEIDRAVSGDKVMDFSEAIGAIPNASGSQVTLEKMLPLRTFATGGYTLKVSAVDRNGSQILQRQGDFTVSLP